jgi:hypothetical protein
MKHSNISGAWRTRYQALSHILTELVAGRLGAIAAPKGESWNKGCAYEAVMKGSVKHCGVGCLFTDSQIRSIKTRGLNGSSIDTVKDDVGTKNLETVTGLKMAELINIQGLHDGEWQTIQEEPKESKLFKYLNKELKKA